MTSGPTERGGDRPSLGKLAMHTPARDWARGRLTGRLDWREDLARSGLPEAVAETIAETVRRTRLWRLEQADLARELIAHFTDALEAGRTGEDAVRAFGDTADAARLIRRARKRNRPFLWRAFVRAGQGLLVLALAAGLFYALLAWRFFTGEPTVSRNFTAEYNERIEAIPEADRAWDLYADSHALLRDRPGPQIDDWPYLAPGHPRYAEALAYLESVRDVLDLVTLAAARPRLGAPLSAELDPRFETESSRAGPAETAFGPLDDPDNPMVVGVLLPELAHMRRLAYLVAFEAYVGAREGDAERSRRAIGVLVAMAGHAGDRPHVIGSLVGIAIHQAAIRVAGDLIGRHPDFFSDAGLRDIAHTVAGFGGGEITVRLEGERWAFEDMLQRIYTDDGRGNGHLSHEGMRSLMAYQSLAGGRNALEVRAGLLGPVAAAVVADRASMQAKFDELFKMVEQAARTPLWEIDRAMRIDLEIEAMAEDPITRTRYFPVFLLMPAMSHAIQSAERATQTRDGLLVGIALELHRRESGAYPRRLDDLVPRFLPAVPPDRITGEPLRYALVEGEPRVWSVGVDRTDNGGRPVAGGQRDQTLHWIPADEAAARLEAGDPSIDGDAVLWPIRIDHVESVREGG
jgi:hypothetical protein